MKNSTDIEIATFEAKCASCGEKFDHPSFGDFAYGEFLFCSENGRIYAYGDGFNACAKLIEVLLPENCGADMYQTALAELADPIFGQRFTCRIHCPKCQSIKLEYWHGKKTGSMWVKPITYKNLLSLGRNKLIQKISEFVTRHRAVIEGL